MLFGTDGIRGTVNTYPMTPDISLKLGMAAGIYFCKQGNLSTKTESFEDTESKSKIKNRSKAIIAKDTRLSGYLIEPAITAGLISVGIDIILVGPMPTPALAMLIKSLRADFGIMITASHNPYYDNGIKIFDRYGFKLSDRCEIAIQDLMLNFSHAVCGDKKSYDCLLNILASPQEIGRAFRLEDAPGRYIEYTKNTFPKFLNLRGLKIVLDCANGAAYKVAPSIFSELDGEIISINCEPNGLNINNQCGSTYPEVLCKTVIEKQADIGIALDGDGDRLLICDEKGQVITGDITVALIAIAMQEAGILTGGGIVVTNISNMALDHYLSTKGIAVWRTKVGDRHVIAEMRRRGCNFGGEQSGHIICANHSNTSDAIIAALQILSIIVSSGQKISELCNLFDMYPQKQINVYCGDSNPLEKPEIQRAIATFEKENTHLRFVIRKSGTEKIVRVMIEGKDINDVNNMINIIENLLQTYKQ